MQLQENVWKKPGLFEASKNFWGNGNNYGSQARRP